LGTIGVPLVLGRAQVLPCRACPPSLRLPAPRGATNGLQVWENLTWDRRRAFQLLPARRVNPAVCSGFLAKRMMGLEPTTFCMASGSWGSSLRAP
jgi:hypothetical protein